MRRLPLPDPGIPDTRSPARFFRWLIRGQLRTLAAGVFFGVLWMLAQAVAPLFVGRALDSGVAHQHVHALVGWVLALAGLGIVQAAAGIGRHRCAVTNWLTATYRCDQLVARSTATLGAALPTRLPPGEVVNMVASDTRRIGNALDISARFSGAVMSFVLVAILLLHTSMELGLVVLIGVPLLLAVVTPLIRPMHDRQGRQRTEVGQLTSLGTDTIAGLRVLRGMGGEGAFFDRYREQSQRVRVAGVEAGRIVSLVDAQQVLLPGIFVVVLTWLGARLAVHGTISVGELIAFYGWAAFLVLPLRTFTEAADKFTRAHVAVERLLRLLGATPGLTWGSRTDWPRGAELRDGRTGLVVPGEGVTVVACADNDEGARLGDRLGRYDAADVTVRTPDGGSTPLAEFTQDTVRTHVLVVDAQAALFGGRLRAELDPLHLHSDDAIDRALLVADAGEIVDGLPEGLDTVVGERGRSLSGGQRQRVILARSVLADPDVLVLVDPTSAVDAHTEMRIADRLREARRGRVTVAISTSPLLLRVADHAALVVDDEAVLQGDRGEVAHHPAFRATIERAAI
jgi:ABC-type multidrug transport system fused ATPase/permease subunit